VKSGHLLEALADYKRPKQIFDEVTKKADIDRQLLIDDMSTIEAIKQVKYQ
jgi:hypothetical protein